MKKCYYYFLLFTLFFSACQQETEKVNEVHGLHLENMDTTVTPQNDFYGFVNGSWQKNAVIPDDEVNWGGFTILRKSTLKDMLSILEKAKKSNSYAAGTDQSKAIAHYNAILDIEARNKAGIAPIQKITAKIDEIKTIKEFQKLVAENPVISNPYLSFSVFADIKNSKMNSSYLSSGGLGLPDKDYYSNDDENSIEIRKKYVEHIQRVFVLFGQSEEEALASAQHILRLETVLAEPRLSRVERRDIRNYDNPRSVADINKMIPTIDWNMFFEDLKLPSKLDTTYVMQLKYSKKLADILVDGNIEDIKLMTKWSTINNLASVANQQLYDYNWDFYSKTLNGAEKQKPADIRALRVVNSRIGEALGKLYVDEKFPVEAKKSAEEMVANLIKAYDVRIKNLSWMSDESKKEALKKLHGLTVKIGYPDKWEDYSKLAIEPGMSLLDQHIAYIKWSNDDNLSKYKKPVDKTKWSMPPQTVNAYFNPLFNEIVFPAAILQPPFFDYKADDAVNYGGIGAVIGHEISHGFDDSGSRFDSDGNLRNWWTDTDLEQFRERGLKLKTQFDSIEVFENTYVNGALTLGENIGDLGGILAAFDGLQINFKNKTKPGEIEGFTPEQRFFMSWATVWRTKSREEYIRTKLKTDPHSPGMYRATEPLKNIDEFYKAFNIKEGDKMYLAPEERVKIW